MEKGPSRLKIAPVDPLALIVPFSESFVIFSTLFFYKELHVWQPLPNIRFNNPGGQFYSAFLFSSTEGFFGKARSFPHRFLALQRGSSTRLGTASPPTAPMRVVGAEIVTLSN